MRGIGIRFVSVSSRTIRWSSGASCSVTGLDRVVAMAILSLNQYIEKLKTSAMPSPTIAQFGPKNEPMRTNRPPSAAIRIQVLTLFRPINSTSPSFEPRIRDDRRPAAKVVLYLHGLTGRSSHRPTGSVAGGGGRTRASAFDEGRERRGTPGEPPARAR